jgi:hypothetical protein
VLPCQYRNAINKGIIIRPRITKLPPTPSPIFTRFSSSWCAFLSSGSREVAEELVLEPVIEEFVIVESIVVVEEFEAGIGVVEDGSVAIINSAPITVLPVESVSVKKNLLSGIAGAGVQVKEVELTLAAFINAVLFHLSRMSYSQLCRQRCNSSQCLDSA